jgi:hypothetical protein
MTASQTQETLSARISLIGGETQNWSDQDRSRGTGPFAGPLVLPVLRQVLDQSMTVLVVGPTAPWLLEQIADLSGSLDVLVRSWPDAQSLDLRLEGKPVRIFCGGFENFPGPSGQYDAVLALDGIPRLYTPDSVTLSWTDTAGRLRDLAKPGGRIVLGVANGLGLDRLLDADVHLKPPVDDDWPIGTAIEATPPPGLEAVRAALAAAGLTTSSQYALYPRPGLPALMIREPLLSGPLAQDIFPVLASTAFTEALGGRPVLTDPSRLARETMRHGIGLQLAPGWLFITTNSPAGPAGAPAGRLPDALTADNLDHPYWSVVTELTHTDDGRWVRSIVEVGRSATSRASGHLRREPARLAGPLPNGTLLEELFLTACQHDDLTAVRRLVRSYAGWLKDQAAMLPLDERDGSDAFVVPGSALFATFENMIMDGDRLAVLDTSWDTTLQVSYKAALTRALRRFGFRVLEAGLPHPWPSGMSPNRLTVTLASMVGVTVTSQLLDETARLEVELEGQQRNNSEIDDQRLYFDLQTGGEKHRTAETGQPRGYREALGAVGRLSTELAESASQVAWLDSTLQLRESQLRRERRVLEDIQNSVSYKMGRAMTAPLRALLRLLRPAVRTLMPKGK